MESCQGGILAILCWLVWFAESREREMGGIPLDYREGLVEVNWNIPVLC